MRCRRRNSEKIGRRKGYINKGRKRCAKIYHTWLLDEISIHLVPVLFGNGTQLLEQLNRVHISLEIIEVIQTAEAIHLRFRVIK